MKNPIVECGECTYAHAIEGRNFTVFCGRKCTSVSKSDFCADGRRSTEGRTNDAVLNAVFGNIPEPSAVPEPPEFVTCSECMFHHKVEGVGTLYCDLNNTTSFFPEDWCCDGCRETGDATNGLKFLEYLRFLEYKSSLKRLLAGEAV